MQAHSCKLTLNSVQKTGEKMYKLSLGIYIANFIMSLPQYGTLHKIILHENKHSVNFAL